MYKVLIYFSSFIVFVVFIGTTSAQELQALVPDFQVNDNGGYSARSFSDIAADNIGNFIAVWEDKRDEYVVGITYYSSPGGDIYVQRMDVNGNSIGDNIKVNDDTGHLGQHKPSVAAAGNGNFIVAWTDERDNLLNEDIFNIYAQRFDASGSPLGSNFRVNTDERDGRMYWDEPCAVGADGTGNFVIAWSEAVGDTGSAQIYTQRYSADGTPLGPNFIVNDFPNSEDNRTPKIAMKASGESVITWVGSYIFDRHPDIYAQRFSADGIALGSNFIVDDYVVEEVYVLNPEIGMDDLGNFLIAWKDHRLGSNSPGLFAQWYDAGGSALGSNFKVNEYPVKVEPYSDNISLAVAGNGSFSVAWLNPASYRISARQFVSDSTAQGNSFFATRTTIFSDNPAVAINTGGQSMVTWTDKRNYTAWITDNIYRDIYAQCVSGDSTLLSEDVKINSDSGSGAQLNPAIAIDSDGIFTIAWQDPRSDPGDIYMRRFSPGGVTLGEQVRVNDGGLDKNLNPAVAKDSSGLAMVVWEDYRPQYSEIYGQFYSSDGVALGGNFSVCSGLGEGYYYKPQVTSIGNGLFVVTWQISFYNIGAQIYSVENGPVGSGFFVNDIQDWKNRANPAVAANDSGTFVIVWEDKRNNTAEIYAQQYDITGQALGNNFRVNDIGGWGSEPALAFKADGNLYIVFTGNGITFQRYGPDGGVVGSNVSISAPGTIDALPGKPDIAIDPSGKFIVIWELLNMTDFTSAIMGRRLSDAGTYIGEEFVLTGDQTNTPYQPEVAIWNSRIYTTWIDNHYAGTSWDVFANVLDFDNPTAIGDDSKILTKFELHQNYPNPFNPNTTIVYSIPDMSKVSLILFNLLGEEIITLVNDEKSAGNYAIDLNAANLPSGVYFYRIQAGSFVETKKMVLVK